MYERSPQAQVAAEPQSQAPAFALGRSRWRRPWITLCCATVAAFGVLVAVGDVPAAGLTFRGNQLWTQDSPGISGGSEPFDWFGQCVGHGDFNNDGHADLAIGVFREDLNDNQVQEAGAVNVIYGSVSGLSAAGNRLFGFSAGAEANDFLGCPLVSGDFNGDRYADLAIGVTGEDKRVDGPFNVGSVTVLYGSAAGLTPDGSQQWTQDSPRVKGRSDENDFFGSKLAAGDFNGDGYGDLAIGAARNDAEPVTTARDLGTVTVLYGSASGLSAEDNQRWFQPGNDHEEGDQFGAALTAADFDGDGFVDLAVGVPFENLASDGRLNAAGAVNVLYGSTTGLVVAGRSFWSQRGDVADVPESGDQFGASLGSGDFNGDGYADLAVGVPGEDPSSDRSWPAAGAVNILYGSPSGITTAGNEVWHQLRADVPGIPERFGLFGQTLTVGDFDGDGFADLAIGAPFADASSAAEGSGKVTILQGSRSGLRGARSRVWQQNSVGVVDVAQAGDSFGFGVTAADFNADGYTDLAVGVPGEDVNGRTDAGAVNVIYGSAVNDPVITVPQQPSTGPLITP